MGSLASQSLTCNSIEYGCCCSGPNEGSLCRECDTGSCETSGTTTPPPNSNTCTPPPSFCNDGVGTCDTSLTSQSLTCNDIEYGCCCSGPNEDSLGSECPVGSCETSGDTTGGASGSALCMHMTADCSDKPDPDSCDTYTEELINSDCITGECMEGSGSSGGNIHCDGDTIDFEYHSNEQCD